MTKTPASPESTAGTPARPVLAAIALGANLPGRLGSPAEALRFAVRGLRSRLEGVRVAPVFRTRPVSPIPQPDYLNSALVGFTDLDPLGLLALLKALERLAGRRPGPRLGPRPLDLDLLIHGPTVLRVPGLTVPHPGLPRRRFVLEPLSRIAPGLRVPPEGRTVEQLLETLETTEAIVEIGDLERVAVPSNIP